jgi:hypothetical protein
MSTRRSSLTVSHQLGLQPRDLRAPTAVAGIVLAAVDTRGPPANRRFGAPHGMTGPRAFWGVFGVADQDPRCTNIRRYLKPVLGCLRRTLRGCSTLAWTRYLHRCLRRR